MIKPKFNERKRNIMYDKVLAATGASFSAASMIWWPMAIFALLALAMALIRMVVVRPQITP